MRPALRWIPRVLGAAALLAAAFLIHPAWHLLTTSRDDPPERPGLAAGRLDDASRLNETAMARTVEVAADPAAAEEQLRALLREAAAENLKIAIAGSRHSMGGHTLYPGGIALDMRPFRGMELDEEQDVLRVGAGATWAEVIAYLNPRGRSVAVMQSNNSFTVGGSLSANCHGWQTGRPPIASTVRSFRILLADGTISRCSREENAELFALALGGYGLFGVILDAELQVAPNELYRLTRHVAPVGAFADTLRREAHELGDARLVYGRLRITPDHFLESGLINVWSRVDDSRPNSPLRTVPMAEIRRGVFRGSVGNDYGKDLRWWTESHLEPFLGAQQATRNELLNIGVELFENRSPASTDILHEYFVTPENFAAFAADAAKVIPRHGGDLLNVTVRDVLEDRDSFLRYADQPRTLCLVMLFNQRRGDAAAEERMAAMTRELIDAALARHGRYYLTYRLHATPEQFRRAYPQAEVFFAKKRFYDPGELFQNELYRRYGR